MDLAFFSISISDTRMAGETAETGTLPDFLSVVFDPTRRKVGNIDLNGWYDYDDEGVKGKRITAVDKGVLKEFLMSRSPIKGFGQSLAGHGVDARVERRRNDLVSLLAKPAHDLRSDEATASNDYDFHDCLLSFSPEFPLRAP